MRISDWSSDVCSSDLAPVHAESRFCPDIEHDPDRFFGVAMLRRHEPARIICPDRQDREIDRPEARADIAEDIARAIAGVARKIDPLAGGRSDKHTSELQSIMRLSYAVFCLKKKKRQKQHKLTKHQ